MKRAPLLLYRLNPPFTSIDRDVVDGEIHFNLSVDGEDAGYVHVPPHRSDIALTFCQTTTPIGILDNGIASFYFHPLAGNHTIECVVDSEGNVHNVEKLLGYAK